MTDLATCYFCGRGPDEALGEYGVVPAAFDPDEGQQISVVLCPDCREKLTAVLQRVVAASDAEPADAGPTPGAAAAADDIVDATTGGDAGESDGDAAAAADPGGSDGDGINFDDPRPAGSTGDVGSSAGPGGQSGGPGEQSEGASGAGGGASAAGGGNGGSDVSGDELMGSNAGTYRKVLRLLQNREFPVRRDEIAAVAANAYELTPQEANSAIDTIVQKGLLVEEGGVLRRR